MMFYTMLGRNGGYRFYETRMKLLEDLGSWGLQLDERADCITTRPNLDGVAGWIGLRKVVFGDQFFGVVLEYGENTTIIDVRDAPGGIWKKEGVK